LFGHVFALFGLTIEARTGLPSLIVFIRHDSVSSLWLTDEAKIETEREEDEMDDGATTADLRCFDKTCPQQGYRNIGEIEIEQNA
jgi:hypothetical protein